MNRFILSAAIISAITLTFFVSDITARDKHYQQNRTCDGSGLGHGFRSHSATHHNNIRGRDIVTKGTLTTINGQLEEIDTEWYLKNGKDTYSLHAGNVAYRSKTGINLKTVKNASVKGFISGNDIAVTTIETDGNVYTFRSDDGRPVWAGQGRNHNCTSN